MKQSGTNTGKKVVVFGEVMACLRTKRYERFVQAGEFDFSFSGAEANVAVSLANYGVESCVVTKVPDTEIGQACINHLRRFGVNTDYVIRGGKRLGLLYLEAGASQRASKVIYDRAGSSVSELQPGEIKWDEIFRDKVWFHFTGITPALSDNAAEVTKEACESARRLGLSVSCDFNFRKKLWTPEKARSVMTGLMEFVDVGIGNEEDAEKVFGIKANGVDLTSGRLDVERYRDVARQLCERFKLRYAAITLRESISASDNNWSGLLSDGKEFYESRRYPVHIVDRVGGGDSFSGGLIYAMLSGMSPQDSLEFAVAASCLKHSIPGDFNLMSVDEVMMLMRGDASGRVQR